MEDKALVGFPIGGFLSLPGERLLFFQRQHWIVLLPLVAIVSFAFLVSLPIAYVIFVIFFSQIFFFLTFTVLASVIVLAFYIKLFTEWYFHFYVITTKKIMELSYRPLSSDTINDVLLSQVRCTEVDVKTTGFIHELFDIGDIAITFDRPTHHQEEFIFNDIKNPREMGMFLISALDFVMKEVASSSVWYKPNAPNSNDFKFTDEIMPHEGEVIHSDRAN